MPKAKVIEALRVPSEQDVREYHVTVRYLADNGTEVATHKFIFPATATMSDLQTAVIEFGQGLQRMLIPELIGAEMNL